MLVGAGSVAATLVLAVGGTAGSAISRAAARSPRGTIRYGSFRSAALRGTVDYSVYLPPGYAGSRMRYPVVFFLHGLPAPATAYRQIGTVAAAVDDSGHPAIVVGVQGARQDEADDEWHDWGPGRNWETATAVELVRVIDSRYHTISSRRGRAIVGISAGGYGATLIADHHPGVYSVIESWSGYFQPTNPAGTQVLDLGSSAADAWADFSQQIPNLHAAFAKWRHSTYYRFYVGTDDTRFLKTNETIDAELRAYQVPNVYFRVYQGSHSWSLWEAHTDEWIKQALALMAKPERI
jgi:S-formylglutathione hydrolase FrmB